MENDNEKKRRYLFNSYSNNLHMLVEHGFIKHIELKYKKTYICPICLRQFSEADLKQKSSNPLTLEDAPPKSLGGKANTLTCKQCNNRCGTEIDFHLVERMNEADRFELLPNSSFWTKIIDNEGVEVNSKFFVESNGTLRMLHTPDKNRFDAVDQFKNHIDEALKLQSEKDLIFNLKFPRKTNNERVLMSLLKTTYLTMFENFGYLFLFEEVYRRVRNQLMDTSFSIYPIKDWYLLTPKPIISPGIYFVEEQGIYCFMVSLELKTRLSTRHLIAYLPLLYPIQYVIKEIEFKRHTPQNQHIILEKLGIESMNGQFSLAMKKPDYDKNQLTDFDKTKLLWEQINAVKAWLSL